MKTFKAPSRYAAIVLTLVMLLLAQGARPFVDHIAVVALEADESIAQENVNQAETWIDVSSLQTERYRHSIAVWNDHIYVLGGMKNDGSLLDSIERATINPDGSLEPWQIIGTLPAPRWQHESIAIDGYVYVVGGSTSGQNLTEVIYAEIQADGSLGPWQTTSSMNEARCRFGVTGTNGYLYAIGGNNASGFLNSVEYAPIGADGSLGPWQMTNSLTIPRTGIDVVMVNNYLYVLSGFNLPQMDRPSMYISSTEYVAVQPDGTLGQWQITASLNIPRGLLAAVTNGDSIYVFGGTSGPGNDSVAISEVAAINSDHTLGPWQYTASMQPDRGGSAAVWANGYAYMTGGATYGTFLNNVERIYVGGNVDPVITVDQGSVVVNEGQVATNSGTFDDVDSNDEVTVSASVGTVTQDAGNSGTWSWAYQTTDGPDQSQIVTITADDGNGGTSAVTIDLTVNNVAPTVDAGPDVTIDEGGTFSGSGSFSDPGADTWTATVDYGDGSGTQPLSLNPNKSFDLSHTYTDNGTCTVTVAVTDDDGGVGVDTLTVTVLDLAPTAAFTWSPEPQDEGSPVQFTDQSTSNPDQITGWAWDFAGLSTSTEQNPSFTFVDDGVYAVCLTVTDDDGSTDTICHDVTVLNVVPSVDAGDDAIIDEGDTFSGSGSFTDPGADTWAATVDYGNGWGTQPLALNPDKSFSVSHVYADDGVYVVTVTVTDDDDGVGSDTTTVTVHNVAPAVDMPTVAPEPSDEGSAVTASATFSDPGVNDVPFACTVNYGDGTGDLSGAISGNTCTGPDHVYADNGSYQVIVSVTDKDSDTGTSTAVFHVVNNVAPTVGPIKASLDPVEVNTEMSVGADFTDPGVLDTHTAIWDWGDDTTSPGIVVETNGSGSVSGSHIYTTPGVYTVKLTVTDDDDDSGESIFQYVVVYDPEGGFVTGGGWIDSPEGAYAPDPSLAGKATFGFVSKYKKGATVPTGQTQFQFRVADLNFHSDSYDWLVVAGHKAKYKGTGTINGAGNYGFMLTAIDAALTPSTDVDLFRIKIWDKDDNDTVIYDNQMGGEDGADPTTAIGGGNIVIHKDK